MSVVTINGEPYTLVLTLAAMEQLEIHFQTTTLHQLSTRLACIGMQDLPTVTVALAEAGGQVITYEEILEAKVNPGELIRAVTDAILLGLAIPQ